MQRSDLIIIGGGIVGLATAYRFLERFPGKTVTVLEKEDAVAKHQTGRNSGVLHSGVYYRPGSLRAINCRLGKEAMEEFCQREGLPYDRCGKVDRRHRRAAACRSSRRRSPTAPPTAFAASGSAPSGCAKSSPIAAGIAAIHVPDAGVTDYAMVARRLAEIITSQGQPRCHERARHGDSPRCQSGRGRIGGRRICRRASRQLCRTLQRPRHAAQRRKAVGPDPARFAASSTRSSPRPVAWFAADLPDRRSELPVPRRPLHEDRARRL